MRHLILSGLLAVASPSCDGGPGIPGPGSPPPAATGARLREVAIGLESPLFLTSPPGDLNRQFIVEKTGTIRIIRNEALVPTPFLDLSAKVSGGSEQGLLGLAFHPQYASNGLFVVNYTNT
ncbi:MAG TPA: PQQ-dependent sugar dehydrogenase, partial [Gemmatimonadales bacterium]|nr:PQQ-dependent sugar dehydrogenase [Gemmatimonadales bacterium]